MQVQLRNLASVERPFEERVGVQSRVGQRWSKGTLAGGGEVAIHLVSVDIGHTRGMSLCTYKKSKH